MSGLSKREAGSAPLERQLPFAHGGPALRGTLRASAEDFCVEEVLGFDPSGEGEHVFLHVEKRDWNTDRLARELARFAGVKPVGVGFAGLKDRRAVARQHFTVHLPGKESPDWSGLGMEGVSVLSATRHHRKLQRGALRGNRFRIRVRELAGDAGEAGERLAVMAREGVPNYFGEQRFGRAGENLRQAERLFRGELAGVPRHKRGLYLSAARSRLFNAVLARRVTDESWNRPLQGEVFALDGSRAWFGPENSDTEIRRRLAAMDIHPSGPLWGRGELPSAGACRELEEKILSGFALFRRGLEQHGMKQDRRALRLPVRELAHEFRNDGLLLEFLLPSGAYATVVLRELIEG